MRRIVLFFGALLLTQVSFGQLSGSYTIPGAPYATIASAISALNTQGVGVGGVTFNVTAGYTETFASPTAGLITTLTGSATNPIVFQKSGAGANPLVTAGTGTGTYDYIFCTGGTDYVTFDGISIQDNAANATATTRMEWGYAILKASTTDGSQNVTIKNCAISLNPANTTTYALYSYNSTYTTPGTSLTVTAASGTNSFNKFFNNTITNTHNGIYLYGYGDAAPYAYYDQGNEIGKDGPNTFTGLGNTASTSIAYGIYVYYQNGAKLANNTFTGTCASTTGSLYVFYIVTGTNSNFDIYGNTISMTYNGTGSFYGMYSSGMGSSGTTNTVNYYNNTFTNTTLPNFTSGTIYFFYISTGGVTANFYGNTVSNCTIGSATATATGTMYYMYFASSPTTAGTTNMYNNSVLNNSRIQSVLASATTYIFYNGGTGNVFNEYNNTINNITIGASGTTYGLYNLFSGTTKNVYNNTFTNILNVNSTIYSLYNGNGTGNAYYYNNKFQNINVASAAGTLYGIYQSSGTNVYYFNNFIGELKAPISTGVPGIYGAYVSGGTSVGFYNNTIYLDAVSSGANFGVTGLYASTTPTVELRNNIIVNNSTFAGTGRSVAYQRSSTTLTSYSAASNNNDFWAGTPGASNLIFYDGTNSDQTLTAFMTRVAPRDGSSITENPPFVTVAASPYDLHMKTVIQTQCESGGATVTAPVNLTSDYDGQPRFPNPGYPVGGYTPVAPDLGADEFGGLLLDISAPAIVFTPFMNTASTSPRTLTTSISDPSGVPTAGVGLPRLYWKKFYNGLWQTAIGTYVSGSTYTFTFGGGVVLNDSIYYYIVAQDNYTPPNVGSTPANGSGYSANPPAASSPPPNASLYAYRIVGSLCGNYNVGTGQVYTTLTAAMADLALKEVTCPVTFTLTDPNYSTSETFPIVIPSAAGVSSTNTVLIKPAASITPTITGNSTTAILKFNGSKYVTLDGSNSGGSTRNLTITNTAASGTTAVIWVGSLGTANGASNDAIKNCIIANGFNVATSYGFFVGSAASIGTAGDDNDNLTIQNNAVSKAYYGIYILGSSIGLNDNLVIANNTLGSATATDYLQYYGIYLSGANAPQVTGNEIFNLIGTPTYVYGIELNSNLVSPLIANNKIHDLQNNNTGGWGAYGINVGTSAGVTGAVIVNNVIYNITTINYSTSSTTYNPFGIRLIGGTGHKIYHNTVNMTGTQFASGSAGTLSAALLLTTSAVTGTDIRDNIFANNLVGLAGSTSYCVYAPSGTTFATINYNDYYPSGTYGILGFLGVAQNTLAAWRTATGQDLNSVSTNPVWVSLTDLHPTNLAVNNIGFYLTTVPTDFAGNLRTNPPDMGAYEFGGDPVVNTTAATAITNAAATLNGTINAASLTVNSFFDYGLTTAYGTSTAGVPPTVTGSSTTPVSLGISGLSGNTLYHYRARGVAGGLTIYGPDLTFTTLPDPPTVVTTAATAVTTTGATLNGTVNANGSSTTVTFQYGLTVAYGTTIAATPGTVTGNSVTPVTGPITGLLPNTLYHYRVVGVNAGGTSNGGDMTFTTLAMAPTVVTNAASNIGTTSAQLNGTVTANNANTTVSFDWGLTAAYGNNVAATPGTVSGMSPTAVLANISGLTTNTTYHFRCVGVNAGGTTYGLDQSFLSGCPPVGPAGAITGPTSVCANSTGKVYSIAAIVNATGYTWTVPAGATITLGQNTTSITVDFGTTSGNVSVYGTGPCGNGAPNSLAVTVNPLPVPTITGPAAACQGSTSSIYTTQASMTGYAWTVSAGGTITAGQGTSAITVTWNAAGAQSVGVSYTNGNGCASASPGTYNVTVNAAPTPTVSGPTSMCVNSGYYNYTTQGGFTNYVWTVSGGGTITFGQGTSQVQVTWNQAGAQWVAVNYTNANGCAAPAPVSLPVTVNPMPGAAGTITGTSAVCGGATGISYSCAPVSNAVDYVWTLPAGASIVSGYGTNAILVDFAPSASSGDITVAGNNLCGNGTPSPAFPVTVTALPAAAGTITGQTALCQGTSGAVYSVPAIANATGYTWAVPSGATIVAGQNTVSVTVDFGLTAVSGNVTVYGSNSCGNGASSALAVTVNPIPATPAITLNLDILSSDAVSGNQWYYEGSPIPGATAQTYQATQSGWYWDVVTLAGCSSDSSNNIYVVITGVNELPGGTVNIYPVPNDGRFTISIVSQKAQTFHLSVFNNIGVMVREIPALEVKGSVQQVVDLRPVPDGIYTIVIQGDNGRINRKIVVNK